MGFQFGMLGGLDLDTTMYSVCIVVLFICVFEFVTGVLEYSLDELPLYNRMVQNIYKELMQMGLISFIIVLYESNRSVDKWLLSIDFAHMLLFFVALFFVVHAFYLMNLSYRTSKYYLKLNILMLKEILSNYYNKSVWETLLFWLPFVSISQLQDSMEFKIAHVLFRDTYYRLPREFDFSMYLTKCLDHYALKTMEVGFSSWIFVAVLVVANYLRVSYQGPFSCANEAYFRRGLGSTEPVIDDHHIIAEDDHASGSDDHASGSDDHGSGLHDYLHAVPQECSLMYMQLFCATAILLVGYIFVILFVGRIYKRRLLRRVGIAGPANYCEFLEFCKTAEETMTKGGEEYNESFRLTPAELRAVIEEFLDVKEHDDEKKLYRHTVQYISSAIRFISEMSYKAFLVLRYYVGLSRRINIAGAGEGITMLLETVGQRTGQVTPAPNADKAQQHANNDNSNNANNSSDPTAFKSVLPQNDESSTDLSNNGTRRTTRESFMKKSKLNQFEKKAGSNVSVVSTKNSSNVIRENSFENDSQNSPGKGMSSARTSSKLTSLLDSSVNNRTMQQKTQETVLEELETELTTAQTSANSNIADVGNYEQKDDSRSSPVVIRNASVIADRKPSTLIAEDNLSVNSFDSGSDDADDESLKKRTKTQIRTLSQAFNTNMPVRGSGSTGSSAPRNSNTTNAPSNPSPTNANTIANGRKVSFGVGMASSADQGDNSGVMPMQRRRSSISSKRSGDGRRSSIDGHTKLNSVDVHAEAVVHAKLSIHKRAGTGGLVELGAGSGAATSTRGTLAQARKMRGLTAVLGPQSAQQQLQSKIHSLLAKQQLLKQGQQHQQQQQALSTTHSSGPTTPTSQQQQHRRMTGGSNNSEEYDNSEEDSSSVEHYTNRRLSTNSNDSMRSGNQVRRESFAGKESNSPTHSKNTSTKDRTHGMIVLDESATTAAAAAGTTGVGGGTGAGGRPGRRRSVLGSATTILTPEEATAETLRSAARSLGNLNADNSTGNNGATSVNGASNGLPALDTQVNVLPPVNEPGGGYNMNRVPTIVGSYLLKKTLRNDSVRSNIDEISNAELSFPFYNRYLNRSLHWLCCCFYDNTKHNAVSPEEIGVLSEDFTDIFLWKSPALFYKAADFGIMMNCLYMGMWSTNFISITLIGTQWTVFWNILMIVPMFLSIIGIGQISLICSLLKAITEVDSNLPLICDVIVEMEDRSVLIYELREKIYSKIECFDNQREIFKEIFSEIDVDGSNSINKFEFREFLRLLELKYSDARFSKLFRALDRNGTDSLSFDDLATVLFDDVEDEE